MTAALTRTEAERLLELGRSAVLIGPEAASWIERLTPEQEGLRCAVEWLAANGRQAEATELAASVWRLWLVTGEIAEGRQLLARVLDGGDGKALSTAARARALYADGLLAFRAGDQEGSRTRNQDALTLARELRDPEAEALALVGLSRVAFRAGNYDEVRSLAGQARLRVQELDRSSDVMPLHMVAAGTRLAGDYEQARSLYTESLELNRALDDARMVSVELHNLGHVSLHQGDLDAAERYFAECADLRRESVDPYDRAMDLLNLAAMAFVRGDEAADRLLAEATTILAEAGIALDPDDQFEVDWLSARLHRG